MKNRYGLRKKGKGEMNMDRAFTWYMALWSRDRPATY